MDRTGQENDPLFQKARVDVKGPLAAAGLLHDHGDEGVHVNVVRVFHILLVLDYGSDCAKGNSRFRR